MKARGKGINAGRARRVDRRSSTDVSSPSLAQLTPASLAPAPAGYVVWLAELKTRIADARRRAIVAVNSELVLL